MIAGADLGRVPKQTILPRAPDFPSTLLASVPPSLSAREQRQGPHASRFSRFSLQHPAARCPDSSGLPMVTNPWPCRPAVSACLQRWTPSFTWEHTSLVTDGA